MRKLTMVPEAKAESALTAAEKRDVAIQIRGIPRLVLGWTLSVVFFTGAKN